MGAQPCHPPAGQVKPASSSLLLSFSFLAGRMRPADTSSPQGLQSQSEGRERLHQEPLCKRREKLHFVR